MLAKEEVIQAILNLNPTADRTWLSDFRDRDLREYLDHLNHAQTPRNAAHAWRLPRHGATPMNGAA